MVLVLVLVFGVSAAAWAQEDGETVWSYQTGAWINSSPAIGPMGTIYVGSDNGKLYALNPNGTLFWFYPLALGLISSSPAFGNDGTIYIGSFDGNLYAINSNGTLKWTFPTDDLISSSPAIGTNGTIYIGSADGKLYAVAPDGNPAWSDPFATGGAVSSSPAFGANGIIHFGSADGRLYAVHRESGALYWQFQTGGAVDSSPAIGNDGTVYVGSDDGNLYAIAPGGPVEGMPLWYYTVPQLEDGPLPSIGSSPTVAPNGTIYFGTDDGRLFALDSAGQLIAGFPVIIGEGSITNAPAIAGDGTIYVGLSGEDGSGVLKAINPNGTLKWSRPIGVANSSPIIGLDGMIYVGSTDGKVYAVYTTGGPPAFSWPLFRHDAFHTGDMRPLIGQTMPAHEQIDVPVNAIIRAYFSVPMNPATITNSFIVHDGVHNIAGVVSYDENTRSAIFTPAESLIYGRQYTATISGDAADTHEVQLDGDYVWTFTVIPRFPISASAGPNGAISPPGTTLVVKSEDQEYTITPAAHYHVLDVQVDGESVQVENPSQPFHYTFTDVTKDHQIVAIFAIDTYIINASAGPGGTIGPSGAVVVNWDASQTFDIFPAAGYHIVDVVVDSESVGPVASYTFDNVAENGHTIAATFAIDTYTIAASVGEGGGGTITPSGDVVVNHGASRTFFIAPSTGYHIQDVVVNGASVGAVNSYTFNNVTADGLTIQATFENQPPEAEAGPNQIVFEGQTVFLNAGGSSDPDGGRLTYLWSQINPGAGPVVVLSSSTSRNPTFVAPRVDEDTVLTFEVQVTDPAGASDTDTVTVTVRDNGLAGFPDATATLISSTGRPVGMALNAGIGVSADLVSLRPISPVDIPDEVNKPGLMPYGLFEIVINVDPNGGTVQVTYYFPDPLPPGFVWYKHDPTLGWINFNAHVVYNPARTQATVTLVDGGAGDADGAANGTIVDPSGPAFVPAAASHDTALTGGEQPSAYKIISVPLMPEDTDPEEFFGEQIGGYDTGQVRIFGWDPTTQSFQEYPNIKELLPGMSVFILSRLNREIEFSGSSTPVSEGPLGTLGYGLPIVEGWNLIGNPFGYEIEVARIVVAQGVEAAGLTRAENHLTQPVLWVWRNGEYVQAETLLPGEGGWLLKYVPGEGTAFFEAVPANPGAAARGQAAVRRDLEQPPAPPRALSEDRGGAGGGGGGGCFVASVGRPGPAGVAALLLIVVGLAGVAWAGRRRRS